MIFLRLEIKFRDKYISTVSTLYKKPKLPGMVDSVFNPSTQKANIAGPMNSGQVYIMSSKRTQKTKSKLQIGKLVLK